MAAADVVIIYHDGQVFAIFVQAPDSSQTDETMKIGSTGTSELEKPSTSTAEGQKTDDDNKVMILQ